MKSATGRRRKAPSHLALKLGLLFCSVLLAYCLCEVGYRIRHFQRLKKSYIAAHEAAQGHIYDADTGYHYPPNVRVESTTPFPVRYSTNSFGNIQDDDYSVEKPDGEFRIVTIGDSFTANVTNTVRWPALLQQRLQNDPTWSAAVGAKRTRVINLGLAGIALVQFDDVYFKDAAKLSPDLVLINAITDDIPRLPFYRGRVDSSRAEAQHELERQVAETLWNSLPWTRLWPELLLATAGKRFEQHKILDPAKIPACWFPSDDEAVAASLAALRRVVQAHPHVLVIWHPMFEEFVNEPRSYWREMRPQFFAQGGDLPLLDVAPYYPAARDRNEIQSWFNFPHDLHNSDLGLRHHAAAVHQALLDHAERAGIDAAAVTAAKRSSASIDSSTVSDSRAKTVAPAVQR
jgi:hypothetical protein